MGSYKILSEITRVAEGLGAQSDTTHEYHDRAKGLLKHSQPTYYDGGIDTLVIQNVLTTFAAGGGGVAAGLLFLRQCQTLLGQWLKNKEARSITVEHTTADNRTWKISITGRNDLDKVLENLEQYEREEQEKHNADA